MNLRTLISLFTLTHTEPPVMNRPKRQKHRHRPEKKQQRKANAGARRIRRAKANKPYIEYHAPESRASRRARGVLPKRNRTHRPGRKAS